MVTTTWNNNQVTYTPAGESSEVTNFSDDFAAVDSLVYLDPEGRVTVEWESLPVNRPYAIDYQGHTLVIRRGPNNTIDVTRIL